jgi:hypothetical protein
MGRPHPTDDEGSAAAAATLHRLGTSFWISQSLYVVAKLGVADRLGGGARDVHALASAVGADPDALYRVMRALASVGVFTETASGRFALTPMGAYLRSEVAGSLRAQFLTINELDWLPWSELLHSVQTGETAFNHYHDVGLFEYLERHPDVGAMFDEAMTGFVTENGLAVVSAYDFSPYATIVDVGGGRGALMTAILQANPNAKGIVFDRPSVSRSAEDAISAPGLAARCVSIGGDFFESVPSGGDLYILASIIHDWNDERSGAILRTCRSAMSSTSKLLLIEMVIPPGDAPSYAKLLDLEMLVLAGGRERTGAEYRALLADAGFRMSRIIPTRTSSSLIEATAR